MFAIMSEHHLFFQAIGVSHFGMVDVTAGNNSNGSFSIWKVHKQTRHVCLKLLFWISITLIDMLSKESFTGLKTLVHIQTVAYGIKLSQDILQFNRGSNWNSLVTKHPFCQCEGLNWQMCPCITPVPKVFLLASPNTAGPPIVRHNSFICCAVFVYAPQWTI